MFPDRRRFAWLASHTRRILARCRRRVGFIPGFSRKPVHLYVPGGDDKYPSFWIRDAVMECRSGLIPLAEMKTMVRVILSFQNGPETRYLAHRLRIAPWAIPDHINLPGIGAEFQKNHPPGAVFYPGTYSPGEDQGSGLYGVRPPDDNIYEVIHLVYLLVSSETSQGRQFLLSPVAGIPVWERLHSGFQAMSVDSRTGLHWNTPTDWSASNFHDALRHMGAVALTSCLRFRAAGQMAELFRCLGVRKEEETYRHLAGCLAETVRRTFQREDGWLVAATQVNRQPDTWSTAMAVYYGLLKNDYATAAAEALARACRDGSLSVNGYLRPTPVWADAIPGKVVWEDARLDREKPYGWYQFGGYWPQPAGYVCWTLARTDRSLAVSLARQLVEHTLRYELEGAPFEWINPAVLKDRPGEGKWYGPSAALPLEGFTRLSRDEDEDEGKR